MTQPILIDLRDRPRGQPVTLPRRGPLRVEFLDSNGPRILTRASVGLAKITLELAGYTVELEPLKRKVKPAATVPAAPAPAPVPMSDEAGWHEFADALFALADAAAELLERSPCRCDGNCPRCCDLERISEDLDALARVTRTCANASATNHESQEE